MAIKVFADLYWLVECFVHAADAVVMMALPSRFVALKNRGHPPIPAAFFIGRILHSTL
jgi:hypothetical protein